MYSSVAFENYTAEWENGFDYYTKKRVTKYILNVSTVIACN